MKSKRIRYEIEIDATVEQVWAVLTSIDDFRRWNPFIVFAKGELTEGTIVQLVLSIPGANVYLANVEVTCVHAAKELAWSGKMLARFLFYGRNRFVLSPLGSTRSKVTQEEVFTGFFVPFFSRFLDRHLSAGFKLMLEALKVEVGKTVVTAEEV